MEDRNIGTAPAGRAWPASNDFACRVRFIPLLAALLFAAPSGADTLHGRVVAVTDGDTVKVLDAANTQWKIRLMGIDAPEMKQAFGARSKANLSDLVYGKSVTVEYSKTDRYGRTSSTASMPIWSRSKQAWPGITRSMRRNNSWQTARPMPRQKSKRAQGDAGFGTMRCLCRPGTGGGRSSVEQCPHYLFVTRTPMCISPQNKPGIRQMIHTAVQY